MKQQKLYGAEILSVKKKVVSIGAHPDDVEIGTGGSLAKHTDKGDDTHIILCTLGGVSGDPKVREQEALAAAGILGAHLHIIDYPVSKLNEPSYDFVKVIKKVIDEINPDRIYVHSPFDYHQVHVTVCRSAIRAAKNIKQILFYEETASTTADFKPNAFVDVTNYIDLKIKSAEVHRTQSSKIYMQPNFLRSLANTRYVLSKIGLNPNGMAEAFILYKFIL